MFVDTEDVLHALEHDQVIPCFQPLVELRTGQLSGFEVLARWDHPAHPLALPLNFIALAEENGMIGQLTDQILRKAFRFASVLPGKLSLSINISPLQMRHAGLATQIGNAADRAHFPLDRLTIEITETSLLSDLARVQETARRLKDMGCRLSLDDFGTGFSSLAHLHALPFDEIKIDRSFVGSMTSVRESRKIIAAVIGLGHSLGLTTVAEGIETEEQAEMLQWMGCERGQGWLYGRPTTSDKIPGFVARPARAIDALKWQEGRAVSSLEAIAQLQAIYDGAPVGLTFLNHDLRHITVNRQMTTLTGVSVAAHQGKYLRDTAPKVYPEVEPFLRRALQGERITGVEVVWPAATPGAAARSSLVSYLPTLDEANEVIGVSMAVLDLSELKRAQQHLHATQESQQHLQQTLAQMQHLHPHATWTMEPDGQNLVVASPRAPLAGLGNVSTRQLGWSHEIHPDDTQPVHKALREALLHPGPFRLEYRIRNAHGDWIWMRSSGLPRRDDTGRILNWYGCIEDIDERKRLEAALLASQSREQSLIGAVLHRIGLRKDPKKVTLARSAAA